MLNAATFIGSNYLARALGGDSSQAALDEKKNAMTKLSRPTRWPYNKYSRNRTQLLDWIETNAEIHAQAKQNFTNTNYAFKLDKQMAPLKEPKFSDFYQPSPKQKNGELLFLGAGTFAIACAALYFL